MFTSLDERSALRILPGRATVEWGSFELRMCRALKSNSGPQKRGAWIRNMVNLTSEAAGPTLALLVEDKRRVCSASWELAPDRRLGLIGIVAIYGRSSLVWEIAVGTPHCSARILERLKTVNMNDVWAELKPTGKILFRLRDSKDLSAPDMIARVPTATGHFVVDHEFKLKTWIPDRLLVDSQVELLVSIRAKSRWHLEKHHKFE